MIVRRLRKAMAFYGKQEKDASQKSEQHRGVRGAVYWAVHAVSLLNSRRTIAQSDRFIAERRLSRYYAGYAMEKR
jgi:hypothetical protein